MSEHDITREQREGLFEEMKTRLGKTESWDPGNLESFLSGRASFEEYERDTARRDEPTFSAGGRGGTADVDADKRADEGWYETPGGQWTRDRDTDGVSRGDGRGGGGGAGGAGGLGQGAFSSWSQAINRQNTVLEQMQSDARSRQASIADRETADRARRDVMFGELQARAQQDLDIDPSDPIIRNQVDTFRAEQRRGTRNLISDTAEAMGALGNIQGQRRIANERAAINTAAFQSQLIGRELTSRRNEVSQALNAQRSMLSLDQQASLQREIDNLDNQLAQVSAGFAGAQAAGTLDLGFGNLGARLELGRRGLDLQALFQEQQGRQFTDRLGFDYSKYWNEDDLRRSGFYD